MSEQLPQFYTETLSFLDRLKCGRQAMEDMCNNLPVRETMDIYDCSDMD